MKWLKENLLKILIFIFIALVVIFVLDRFFKDESFEEKLKKSDEKIAELDKHNAELDQVILDSKEMAEKVEAIVAEKEELIRLKDLEIEGLQKEEALVEEAIEDLTDLEVVVDITRILELPGEVELRNQEVVFTLSAANKTLVIFRKQPLIIQQRDKALEAKGIAREALRLQKVATWNVYRIAWAQTWQISNWVGKYKEKVGQFKGAMKQKRKAWLDGVWKGFVVGVIVTIIFSVLRGRG